MRRQSRDRNSAAKRRQQYTQFKIRNCDCIVCFKKKAGLKPHHRACARRGAKFDINSSPMDVAMYLDNKLATARKYLRRVVLATDEICQRLDEYSSELLDIMDVGFDSGVESMRSPLTSQPIDLDVMGEQPGTNAEHKLDTTAIPLVPAATRPMMQPMMPPTMICNTIPQQFAVMPFFHQTPYAMPLTNADRCAQLLVIPPEYNCCRKAREKYKTLLDKDNRKIRVMSG